MVFELMRWILGKFTVVRRYYYIYMFYITTIYYILVKCKIGKFTVVRVCETVACRPW